MKLGLSPDKLTNEGRDLQNAGLSRFDEVILIDPKKTWAALEYKDGKLAPKIFHNGKDISDLAVLIVRRSGGMGASTGVMARVLQLCGCDITDPPSRYSVGFSSKITTSISRYAFGIGSETFYAFYREGAHEMVDYIKRQKKFPVVVKPVRGLKSRGRRTVRTRKRLHKIVDNFFDKRTNDDMPFYVQVREDIIQEYRVLLCHTIPIATIKKVKQIDNSIGSQFETCSAEESDPVEKFCALNCSQEGIVGADVAKVARGFVLIEENRTPGWNRMQRVVNFDIAQAIYRVILGAFE